jgi:hypothetical protein
LSIGLLFFFRASSIYLTAQTLPLTTCKSTISEDTSAAVEAFYIMVRATFAHSRSAQ